MNKIYKLALFPGLIVCTAVFLIALSACSLLDSNQPQQDDPLVHEAEPVPQPLVRAPEYGGIEDDGVLRLSMRHPITLNPLLNEDATVAPILRLLFEPLVVLDETLRPTGHLVNMELASDFSTATLTIRDDAIWSDGIPVTVDDIIFSVEILRRAPDTVIYKRNVENIARVDRVNSRTALVTFQQASVTASYALSFPIIPEHYYSGHVNTTSPRNMQPLGNGPYNFASRVPMQSMILEKNPYTFRRTPTISVIEVLLIPDAQTKLHAFDQGVIDAIRLPFAEWVKHPSVKPVNHEEFLAMYFEFIGFNFERGIFRNINARQAVAHAFNADEAINAEYLHRAVRAASPIHPRSWMHDNNITGPEYDPARAAVLLRAINIPEPLQILVNTEHIERVHIANRLATGLVTAGHPAIVIALPFDEYYARLQDGEFDLYLGGMKLDFVPDFAFMFQGGPLFTSDPVLEGLFASLSLASTESAYLQAVSQLQQGIVDRLPIISLGFRHSAVLTGTRVAQGRMPASDHVFIYVNEWEIVDSQYLP
ncbi:MAG: ABC transporter substrate-binding protein [Defluviitaleaceae bacterium]|nr:ABC transporter substrate-binding protein [Defluviitaleaceae bacterium]